MIDGEGADLIKRSNVGLTCPAGNADGLANIVLELSSMSQNTLIAMGKRGPEVMLSEFDRTHLMDRLENWLLELQEQHI
jgi:hypothetical protein